MKYYFFILRLLPMLAEDALFFIIPVETFHLTASASECGILYLIMVSLRLFSFPLAGFLCDRLGERLSFLASFSLRAIFCAMSALMLSRCPHLAISSILLAVTAAEGVLSGFSSVSWDAALSRALPLDRQSEAQAQVQIADQFAVFIGPLIGAFVLRRVSLEMVLFLAAGLFIVSAVLFGWRIEHRFQRQGSKARYGCSGFPSLSLIWADLQVAVKQVCQCRLLFFILWVTFLDNFMIGLQGASITPLVLSRFGETEASLAVVLTLGGITALVAALLIPIIRKFVSAKNLWLSSVLLGYLGFFLTGIANRFLVFATGLTLVEVSCSTGIYALRVLRTEWIPSDHAGKVLGTTYFLQQLSLPLGGLLVGILRGVSSLQNAIVVSTLCCGILSLFLFMAITTRASKTVSE